MTPGKSLRLRRIFSSGRALIVDSTDFREDPAGKIRHVVRAGVDAIVLTPAVLDQVADDLGTAAAILRLDVGPARIPAVRVHSALEMGADAVLLAVGHRGPAGTDCIQQFAAIAEDARRFGVPLLARMVEDDWLESARIAGGYGADIVEIPYDPGGYSYRTFTRAPGRPFLVSLMRAGHDAPGVLARAGEAMDISAQGVVIGEDQLAGEDPAPVLAAAIAMVRQGVPLEDALRMLQPAPETVEPGNET